MMARLKYIQVRADDEGKKRAKRVADEYGVTISDLFWFALAYIDTHKPPLTTTVTITPKKNPPPSS